MINYYDVPTIWSTIEAHYDLQSGRYVAQGFDNTTAVNTFNVEMQPITVHPAGAAHPRSSLSEFEKASICWPFHLTVT